jgi:Skp family chaperone for outer membrane proteins
MMTRHTAVLLLAFALIVTLGIAGARAAGALRAQPTAVAVVDLQRVVDNLRQQQQVRADLQSRGEQLQRELNEKRKHLANLQNDLDLLQEGSPAYQQKATERDRATIDLRAWQEFETRRLMIEEQVQIEALIRKVNETIERVAEEQGFHLVLFKGQTMNLRDGQQQAQVNIRIVAYNNDTIDLTEQVTQRMNNEFSAGAR